MGLVRPVLRSAHIGARPHLSPEGLGALAGLDPADVFSHRGVAQGQCLTCHNGVAAQGLPPRHLTTRVSCDSCHRTTAWQPAQFSHEGVAMGQCQTCHNGLAATGKSGRHFMTARACDACHKVVAWVPVFYNHTSPAYQFAPDKPACVNCHLTNGEIIPRQMRGGTRPRPVPEPAAP
jgi:hypothetical protein